LGLEWQEPVLRQSAHFADYRAAAEQLERLGLLYRCFMTRAELAALAAQHPHAVDPDGAPRVSRVSSISVAERARRQEGGRPYALRLDLERALAIVRERTGGTLLSFDELTADGRSTRRIAVRPERWGDVVIVRKDVPASYHLRSE